jgi:hypothetical protein
MESKLLFLHFPLQDLGDLATLLEAFSREIVEACSRRYGSHLDESLHASYFLSRDHDHISITSKK